ncbi:MAG: hypothetical protein HC857_10295, partial [Synechococcales cyanobacterium RU_4_20]|nr:hypothetical protein [Synechococcales cyanobacterium RU_4_20]
MFDDPAWQFKYDSQGLKDSDVDDVTVVYSILTRASQGAISLESKDTDKAKNLVVRNGPINLTDSAKCDLDTGGRKANDDGWQKVGSTRRKAIQVHALAIPGPNNPNKTIATLEMQQDKQGNVGNKWGAWFRNDMEIFPGPVFRWNGALNTGGSYFVRSEKAAGNFKLSLYPISDPDSCVATEENSVMVMPLILNKDKDDLNDGQTYQGQLIVGSLRDNNIDAVNTGGVRLFGREAEYAAALTRNTDSTTITNKPIELALDPVALLTEGLSRRRDGAVLTEDNNNLAYKRDQAAWEAQAWFKDRRIINNYEKTPFVDDTYRADNRWGPKPVYREKENVITKIETPRTTATNPPKPDYSLLISDPDTNAIPPSQNANDQSDELTRLQPLTTQGDDEINYGLDGYWERRSRTQGVRIIVGQRLELGNVHGWKTEVDANNDGDTKDAGDGDIDLNNNGLLDFDPLYPPPANPGRVTQAGNTTNGSMATRQNELMQWKTLRNNPAAAQSTAVYHYLMDEGRYPTACLASAAHPGTRQSIEASTTFNRVTGKSVPKVSFLTGEGTNGWEFAPFGAETYADNTTVGSALTTGQLTSARTAFATEVNLDTSALRIALSNLAYFSGDLAGAFPAFQDSASEKAAGSTKFRGSGELDTSVVPRTHPYPILTMWGDYSNLRRVINRLDGGPGSGGAVTYDQLSLADQTTLQTASCTLGVLAYNIETETAGTAALGRGAATSLYRRLNALNDKNRTNGEIEVLGTRISVWREGSPATGGTAIYTAQATNPTPADVPLEVIAEALPDIKGQLLALQKKEQINRDRRMGFSAGPGYTMVGNQLGGVLGMPITRKGQKVTNLQCDFDGNKYFNQGKPRRVADEQRFLTLAYAICPRSAKYPSLYYLFPKENHDHIGTNTDFPQPTTEPYTSSNLTLNGAEFDNRYAFNRANGRGANVGPTRFRCVVAAAGSCGTDSLQSIALVPKAKSAWALPTQANASGSNVIKDAVTTGTPADVSIALLDKGIFNGREHMGVRVLDLDLNLLRNASITGKGKYKDTDFWLPLPQLVKPEQDTSIITGALLYAFREDAMREDGIARPRKASPAAADWKTAWRQVSLGDGTNASYAGRANYLMRADAFNTPEEQDPPRQSRSTASAPNPVDFFADPARRPNGFRLRNGVDLT